jgi:hypothetical protein
MEKDSEYKWLPVDKGGKPGHLHGSLLGVRPTVVGSLRADRLYVTPGHVLENYYPIHLSTNKIKAIMEDGRKQVYLLTNRDNGTTTKAVYSDIRMALKEYYELYDQCIKQGYTRYETTLYDDLTFKKNAKLTNKQDGHVVRLNLERVEYIGFQADKPQEGRDGHKPIHFTDADKSTAGEEVGND